jgi:hypothetical protein
MQRVAGRDGLPGSGVATWAGSQLAGRVIFHEFEVHELEYRRGPKFRRSVAGLDLV